MGVAEGTCRAGIEECLRGRGFDQVRTCMAVADVSAQFQASVFLLVLSVFPTEVQSGLLVGHQSLSATKSARTAESAVAGIVGRAESRHAAVVSEACGKHLAGIAVVRTITQVYVCHPRFVELPFGCNVEHGCFFAIVDAGQLGVVALFVVRLDATYHVRRQVFHGYLGIALEEILAVDEEFLHLFAVPLDGTIVTDFHAGQLLHQGFEGGALGYAIGRGIEHRGVFLLLHAGRYAHDGGRAQLVVGGLKGERTEREGVGCRGCYAEIFQQRVVAHKRHL